MDYGRIMELLFAVYLLCCGESLSDFFFCYAVGARGNAEVFGKLAQMTDGLHGAVENKGDCADGVACSKYLGDEDAAGHDGIL